MADVFESSFAAQYGKHEAVIRDSHCPVAFAVWGMTPDVFLSSGPWSITLTPDMAEAIGDQLIKAAGVARAKKKGAA